MENENKQRGIAIWSVVIGVVGILWSCMAESAILSVVSLIIAIIALVKKESNKGLIIAGLVCAISGLGVFLISSTVFSVDRISDKEANESVSEMDTENELSQDEVETEIPVYDQEILFRDIPWGTSCTEVEKIWGNLFNLSGDGYKTFSADDIILGDYQGIDFEYDDINIISTPYEGEVDVAGYTTSKVSFYFAYIPVDGVLTREEQDSALYGARYEFEAKNLEEMSKDLIQKLTSVYGEPAKTTEKTDLYDVKYTYTYWYGSNDTVLVLKAQDTTNHTSGVFEDEIYISYVWLKGDELLQEASDISKQEALDKEAEAYGNDSTGGL